MRVFGLWLCFTALVLVAAPVLSVAAPPAPDPAPSPTSAPAPAPDPAPAAQPPAAETRSAPVARTPPPVDARPVRVVAPSRVAVPVPASRPAPKRREARRERTPAGAAGALPASLQRATAWPRLPLKPVTGETADRGPLLRAAVGLLLLVAAGTASLRLMVRLAGPALVVLAVLAGLPAEARAAPALTYACSPAPANCLGWYRSSVTVRWDWDQLIAMPNGGNCFETRFTNDTATARANCEIRELGDPFMTTAHSVPIRIDRVPPTGQGFTSSRPPDYGGWFNHPVTLSFKGSDGTSGVAGCDTVGFGGPDGQAVPVSGRCRDRAGNVGTASYAVAYDATPPGAPRAQRAARPPPGQPDLVAAGGRVAASRSCGSTPAPTWSCIAARGAGSPAGNCATAFATATEWERSTGPATGPGTRPALCPRRRLCSFPRTAGG